jgi:glutamine amidotransferase
MTRVTVIAYGIGNVQSMVNALKGAGADVQVAENGEMLEAQAPDRIVMPGVGAAGTALQNLHDRKFGAPLEKMVLQEGKPFLGVCVGMQVLFEMCEEFGIHQGLGWLPGRVIRLAPVNQNLRLPHVGWNNLSVTRPDKMLEGIADHHFYFLHSYVADCSDDVTIARADYGGSFAAAVRRDNIVAVQFHPEKSSGSGRVILTNFLAT